MKLGAPLRQRLAPNLAATFPQRPHADACGRRPPGTTVRRHPSKDCMRHRLTQLQFTILMGANDTVAGSVPQE